MRMAAVPAGVALVSLAMVTASASAAYQDVILADSPVVYYRLGESSGTTAVDTDGLSPTLNGTYQNSPSLNQPGLVAGSDGAVGLNGTDEWINVPSHAAVNNDAVNAISYPQRTIEMWFKPASLSGTSVLFEEGGHSNGFVLHLDGDDIVVGAWSTVSGITFRRGVDLLQAGGTYHVALVFDADNDLFAGYLNGQLFGGAASAVLDPMPEHSGVIGIGAVNGGTTSGAKLNINGVNTNVGGPGFYFNGVIDEFALYNTALSAATIASHYGAAAIPEPAALSMLIVAAAALRRR